MRRIVIWIASTVTILVLLFGYHTSTNQSTGAGAKVATSSGSGVASAGPTSGSTVTPSATASPTRSAASAGSSPWTRSSASSLRPATTSYTGAEAQTRWGIVQVKITVTDGKITAVDVPEYPNGNPRDGEITAAALPTLVQETLTAQGANIDMVSGATVTSDGYLQSLQSALDQAGVGK